MTDRIDDPWDTIETNWPWIEIHIRRLPDRYGQTVWTGGKPHIELAHDLGPVQQRCTLAHEMHHLEAGLPCRTGCDDNERAVTEATARWLLPSLRDVGEALSRHDIATAAGRLRVTRSVLNDRLLCLTEAEEAELGALLEPGSQGDVRAANGGRRPAGRVKPHRCGEPTARTNPARPEPGSRPTVNNDTSGQSVTRGTQ